MVVEFAATSDSTHNIYKKYKTTHSTNRHNFSFKTNYVTGDKYLAKMDIVHRFSTEFWKNF